MRKKAEKSTVQIPRLAQINPDVLGHIFSYLDLTSVARLGQTCYALQQIVEQYGWRAMALQCETNTNRRDCISLSRPSMSEAPNYKHLLQVDRAWASKTFRSYQFPLPSITTKSGGKADRHQPQSILLLTPLGLLLFTGCEMRLWTKSQLRRMEPIQSRHSQLFQLVNPAGLDDRFTLKGGQVSALWDICACTQLDHLGHFVAIGRLNGLVEIMHIAKDTTIPQRDRGMRMAINLVWICNPITHNSTSPSVQAMHACPSSGVLTVAYKDGSIRMYKLHWQKGKLNVILLSLWNIGMRPWSVHVYQASWIAIGVNDMEPIIVYPLHKTSHLPMMPLRLSTGTSTKMTSVYALQTQIKDGTTKLLAGCYDGTLRRYDIDVALTEYMSSSFGKTIFPILPEDEAKDRFDPSAIYCLCDGVGENAMQVAAGTARYGVCKFLQLGKKSSHRDCQDESWSIFAAHPSQSPTYSLVGQYDRLFGVTNAVFWQIDLRDHTFRRIATKISDGMDKHRQTFAYYHHKDMVLDKTSWPTD